MENRAASLEAAAKTINKTVKFPIMEARIGSRKGKGSRTTSTCLKIVEYFCGVILKFRYINSV